MDFCQGRMAMYYMYLGFTRNGDIKVGRFELQLTLVNYIVNYIILQLTTYLVNDSEL